MAVNDSPVNHVVPRHNARLLSNARLFPLKQGVLKVSSPFLLLSWPLLKADLINCLFSLNGSSRTCVMLEHTLPKASSACLCRVLLSLKPLLN